MSTPASEEDLKKKARVAFVVANSWTYDQLIKFVVNKLVEEYDIDEISLMGLDYRSGVPAESAYGRRPGGKDE